MLSAVLSVAVQGAELSSWTAPNSMKRDTRSLGTSEDEDVSHPTDLVVLAPLEEEEIVQKQSPWNEGIDIDILSTMDPKIASSELINRAYKYLGVLSSPSVDPFLAALLGQQVSNEVSMAVEETFYIADNALNALVINWVSRGESVTPGFKEQFNTKIQRMNEAEEQKDFVKALRQLIWAWIDLVLEEEKLRDVMWSLLLDNPFIF